MSRKREPFTKERVKAWLELHFLLRLHMMFILAATFGAGLLATKILLVTGVNMLAIRYGLAVFAAYLTFLFLIRLWLFYVNASDDGLDFAADGINFGSHFTIDSSDLGGGGRFGGGGASGSWGQAAPVKSSGGSSFNFDFGDDDFAVVILFIALVLSILVIGIYLIYTAPALLSEAAFEAALAAALAKRAKQIHRPGWMGTVWRATVWPFVIVFALSIALGWFAQKHCPEAKRLRDVFTGCKAPR
jgi:hypothetical protein